MKSEKNTIHSLLPKRSHIKTVQSIGRVEIKLFRAMNAQRKKEGISWRDILQTCFRQYLGEAGQKKWVQNPPEDCL